MNVLKSIISRATRIKGTVVLPEGMDSRVIEAACLVAERKVCKVIVLGTPGEIAAAEQKAGKSLAADKIEVIDYTKSDLLPRLAKGLYERRKEKGMTEEQALQTVSSKRLYFGGMMVHEGLADGLVAGSIASTGDMLRSAFHTIGTAPGVKFASSAFLLDLKTPTPGGEKCLVFADCAVNPNPDSDQLVDIGLASAETYKALVGGEPRVAFLSYSTKGSAAGDLVKKVQDAVAKARPRFAAAGIVMDGELQLDAALVPAVAAQKNPGGAIQGNANVLVFPDLQAGNIGYKLTQRLAGATAVGPSVQGLAKPMNDLSRGCSGEEIFGSICITVLMAAAAKARK